MKNNLKSVKSQVEWCLEHKPISRNCDMKLCISVWKNFHRNHFFNYVAKCMTHLEVDVPLTLRAMKGDMDSLPSMESIGRVRRKFQENGEYMPTDPKVYVERQKKIKEYRDFSSGS